MAELQPGTSYHIPGDAQIILTGTEFLNILNTLNKVMQSPVYQEQLAIANTVASVGSVYEIATAKLKDLVEAGTATPATEQPSNNIPLGKQEEAADAHIMD